MQKEYLVKWYGYPTSQNTWEPADNIPASSIRKFNEKSGETSEEEEEEDKTYDVEKIEQKRNRAGKARSDENINSKF